MPIAVADRCLHAHDAGRAIAIIRVGRLDHPHATLEWAMTPADLLYPAFRSLADRPEPEIDLSPEGLASVRRLMLQMFEAPDTATSSRTVDVRELHVPGPSGAADVRCLVYTPAARAEASRAAILEIHGGGFMLGAPEQNDRINRAAAERLDCVVVAVDYRLAPEAPPVGAVKDCHAVLCWMHAQADALGIDAGRIAVRGDSGGGGIAAALALFVRDTGGPAIAFQLLIYPMLDDRTGSTVDRGPYAGFVGWSAKLNRTGWRALLGAEPGGPTVSALQSPARAQSLAGLPPSFIAVGVLDLFFEENLEYARRLARDGVPVELHVYPGAPHGFDRFNADAELSQAFRRDVEAALRRAFAIAETAA